MRTAQAWPGANTKSGCGVGRPRQRTPRRLSIPRLAVDPATAPDASREIVHSTLRALAACAPGVRSQQGMGHTCRRNRPIHPVAPPYRRVVLCA